ncbi:uncharacterized protein NECHADRAFT_101157 [Fusarium vanettenii 77-13-4]|uniref:Sulfatase N-terminal domain-containing protein n=1 Tax=Fusarium vanettenii (strain ATCC MYA-4622 / CBS 123669 / FGSC 9596 / NRRL 45880 / 77-13-4) TaxID=660122 RepID=C7Z3G5_FUSV7|nr:uncharacterized protein NECHADRAFT_101157 [Fusarium vanettenii 77-13-4]EEU41130.1 hypothetical protein NECHADRAFT_101157 [Fusarium vanettenii 77-13-4]
MPHPGPYWHLMKRHVLALACQAYTLTNQLPHKFRPAYNLSNGSEKVRNCLYQFERFGVGERINFSQAAWPKEPRRRTACPSHGFSDIGCYGAKIQTPNIDRLASEGIRMLNHHAAAACSPTRAMLLSGTDAHLGGLGVLIEYKRSESGAKRFGGKAGYEGYLNNDVATIPEVLQDNGYFTAMSGKERFPVGGRPVHAEEGKKVDIYKGMYDDGPYALRERRLKKLVELGIIDESVVPHKVETETMGVGEWDELTPEEKKQSSRAMEAYAGMVDSIDVNVGKIVEYLKETGEYDNTFIVFMSDNGAEGAAMEAVPSPAPFTNITITRTTTLDLGTPSLGSLNRSFSTVMDFAPTFLELAGVSVPPASEKTVSTELGKGSATAKRSMTTFRGKDVHAMRGKSWIPHFARGKKVEDEEKGDWKIVHFDKTEGGAGEGDEGWELFNIAEDPGETTDLAKNEPEKLKELLAHWDEYVVECGIVWGEVASSSGVSKDEAPQLWEDEVELQKAWMGARGGDCPVDCKWMRNDGK